MQTKKCYKCKRELPLENFKKHAGRRDGLQSDCIECQKEYRRKHYIKNKEKYVARAKKSNKVINLATSKWLNDYKSKHPCVKCGESHIACLQFHHKYDNKEFNVSQIRAYKISLKRLELEVAKCDVLCANCHFKHHWEEKQMTVCLSGS